MIFISFTNWSFIITKNNPGLALILQLFAKLHNSDIHSDRTRNRNKFYLQRTNHRFADECMRHMSQYFNETPGSILDKVNTHCLQGYSHYIKLTCLSAYCITCAVEDCYVCSWGGWIVAHKSSTVITLLPVFVSALGPMAVLLLFCFMVFSFLFIRLLY